MYRYLVLLQGKYEMLIKQTITKTYEEKAVNKNQIEMIFYALDVM